MKLTNQKIWSLMGIHTWTLRDDWQSISNTSQVVPQSDHDTLEVENIADDGNKKSDEKNNEDLAHKDLIKDNTVALPESSSKKEISQMEWPDLSAFSERGDLCHSCKNDASVFGQGNPDAEWLFVVDSPSMYGIKEGDFLSLRQTQLYQAILNAMNIQQDNVYLSSIFKCPPAQDLNDNAAQCGAIIHQQIKLLNAKKIIAFGEFVGQSILHSNDDLSKFYACSELPTLNHATVCVTHSLAQMLQTPSVKSEVWQQLKKILVVD